MTQIKSVLIVNRGEITCRIIETARIMGIHTIAVYAESDQDALHVKEADAAFSLEGVTAAETYLNQDKLIEVALKAGADAIHPGYGFLSENADFVEAVTKAGLVFIGPTSETMRIMGDKAEAKMKVAAAGVPTLPGYEGEDQSDKVLCKAAEEIGYPLIIKPAAGGGGKGMKIVNSSSEVQTQIDSARREAKSSFGDDRLILERYLPSPRHIEVQIFGDCHGNVIHLFERECTLQRRHQKIIEEAPSVNLSAETMKPIYEAAVKAGQAVNYEGAGTVEFLLDGDKAYFMEMNTRLQVEHPVTEMVTGLDLVRWQFEVAAGEALDLEMVPAEPVGHAIEARIYAEDPTQNFLPSTGKIYPLEFGEWRVDTGVVEGDSISHLFDPMIAKIIVRGETRDEALAIMDEELSKTHIGGIKTNVGFVKKLINHTDIQNWNVDVTYIDKNLESLIQSEEVQTESYIMAGLALILARKNKVASDSPWAAADAFRINHPASETMTLYAGDVCKKVTYINAGHGYLVSCEGQEFEVQGHLEDECLHAQIGSETRTASLYVNGAEIYLFSEGASLTFKKCDRYLGEGASLAEDGGTTAPMTGKVVDVLVSEGETVEKGAKLVIMEAMKMEHVIKAHAEGTIREVHFKVGDIVEEGASLVALDIKEAS